MASTLLPFSFRPMTRSDYRLACGLALSLLAHLLLIAGVRPMTTVYAPPAPLQVDIRQSATAPDAPLSIPASSDAVTDTGPDAPAVAAAIPEPVRSVPGAVPGVRPDPRLPLERYYTSLELDVRAEPLNYPPLIYPQRAYQERTRGRVTLRILINQRGSLDEVTVLASEPRGVFEEAALDAVRSLQFSPAMRFGQRVKSQKTIEVEFDPYASIHVP